jgi:hypothetical protein
LSSVPAERLDDGRLVALYQRAREWRIGDAMIRAAHLIAERGCVRVGAGIEPTTLYVDLALDAARRRDRERARQWLERGRDADSSPERGERSLMWELTELQLQTMLDGPEVWVATLAGLLERHRSDQESTSQILIALINLGLVQLAPDPYHPDQMVLDTRILQSLLSQYGPRITTASGELASATARSEIWTPDSAKTRESAGIWTPGSPSTASASSEKAKIIYPG